MNDVGDSKKILFFDATNHAIGPLAVKHSKRTAEPSTKTIRIILRLNDNFCLLLEVFVIRKGLSAVRIVRSSYFTLIHSAGPLRETRIIVLEKQKRGRNDDAGNDEI